MIEQLLTAAGNRVGIQTEETSQNRVAAPSQADGFQTGV
jgi:hypothetical protein